MDRLDSGRPIKGRNRFMGTRQLSIKSFILLSMYLLRISLEGSLVRINMLLGLVLLLLGFLLVL